MHCDINALFLAFSCYFSRLNVARREDLVVVFHGKLADLFSDMRRMGNVCEGAVHGLGLQDTDSTTS
jgi:hypothetical protein